jgi:hypothetical protein
MMENFAKLIQSEWENIWDFVFGRDVEPEPDPEPAESETEIKTETKETL